MTFLEWKNHCQSVKGDRPIHLIGGHGIPVRRGGLANTTTTTCNMLQAEVPLVPIDLLLEIKYPCPSHPKAIIGTTKTTRPAGRIFICTSYGCYCFLLKLLILIQASRVVNTENLQRCMCGSPSRLQSLKPESHYGLDCRISSIESAPLSPLCPPAPSMKRSSMPCVRHSSNS